MKFTLKDAVKWCGGKLDIDANGLTITGVSTDSRSVKPGELFVPIAGGNFDGHDYIEAAAKNGAAATLCERPVQSSVPVIKVESTVSALGALAREYRNSLNLKIAAITGSVGKTTAKEMTAAVLSRNFKTAKTQGNFNNEIGLPLTIFQIDEDCEAAVLELGMNHFGELSRLSAIAEPDLAVITNIGTMHIEYLGSRQGILKAKLEILEGLRPGGIAVFNGDEPLLWDLKGRLEHPVLYFGIENEDCDVRAEEIIENEDGITFSVKSKYEAFDIFLPVRGRHNVYNALVAVSVGLQFGVPADKIRLALSWFENTGMRQRIYEKSGFTIIEDCYNAGPESMKAALEVLGGMKAGRKIAVLGSMLELGEFSQSLHEEIGVFAAEKADILFTYGKDTEFMVEGAKKMKTTKSFLSHEALIRELTAVAKPGDVLLFKGSRGVKMERVLEGFLDNSQKA